MKKLFSVFTTLIVAAAIVVLVGCNKATTTAAPANNSGELTYVDGTELKLAVAHNSTATTITFQDAGKVGEGLTLADGKTYHLNDLKPVWAQLETELSVKFKNVYSGATSAEKEYAVWDNLNFAGVDVVVGNADDIAEDGKTGKMIDLSLYLDYMPNFKAFLEANPIVYLSVISDTTKGSIYYAPYFDGFDDIEKYFLFRIDWIEDLLDGEGAYTAEASDTFGDICKDAVYEPYMPTTGKLEINSLNADGTGTQVITKDYTTTYGNIAKYMNDHVTASTTGVEMVNMLRNYIDAAYAGKYGNTRSHLFTGYDACWDADELVALLRCVVTNTQKLTGQNTTKVTGLFPREKALNRTSDLFCLTSLFGVRGNESRNDYLYFDAEGNLCDARSDAEFADAISKLNQLYQEGLIMKDFDTTTDVINKTMFQKNLGFGLYDYLQTQCLYNEDADTLKADADFNLSACLSPVALWFDGSNENTEGVDQGTYMRFTESWRSVKTNGWAITSTISEAALPAALKLFDYMYSEEGAILMSYGPEAWRSGETITYKGEQIPELSDKALKELWDLAGGNYTNYARQYLGSTLPVGFVKDQGMEYQCTTENGKTGGAKVSSALAAGVIKHISPEINENLFYTMVPTILPTTASQDLILNEYGAIQKDGLYSKSSGKYNIYIEILKNGLGSGAELSNTYIPTMPATAADLIAKFKELGGQAYILVNAAAWEKLSIYYETKIKK